ncbi:MAG: hypothetical protein KDD45_03330, partial [Bdellovibrionales bacterium]|nr:hypothetical protein [Bdellovibrionales bacterium]
IIFTLWFIFNHKENYQKLIYYSTLFFVFLFLFVSTLSSKIDKNTNFISKTPSHIIVANNQNINFLVHFNDKFNQLTKNKNSVIFFNEKNVKDRTLRTISELLNKLKTLFPEDTTKKILKLVEFNSPIYIQESGKCN